MKNLISIVEIPTRDFNRAMNFYRNILSIDIDVVDMEGIKMGIFLGSEGGLTVQLLHAEGYQPSAEGTIVYLNGGDDLQRVADKVEMNGGRMVVPKTEIAPEMGHYAQFTDTEGNRLGLHSPH